MTDPAHKMETMDSIAYLGKKYPQIIHKTKELYRSFTR